MVSSPVFDSATKKCFQQEHVFYLFDDVATLFIYQCIVYYISYLESLHVGYSRVSFIFSNLVVHV